MGGGYELANLWPAIPGETKNGVTLTASEGGSYTAMLDPAGDASNQQTGAFTVASTETWAARIFTTAATGPVNATVTPRLYKID